LPEIQRSSAVLTTTERSSGERSSFRPKRSFGVPVPPLNTSISDIQEDHARLEAGNLLIGESSSYSLIGGYGAVSKRVFYNDRQLELALASKAYVLQDRLALLGGLRAASDAGPGSISTPSSKTRTVPLEERITLASRSSMSVTSRE
jgi:hypothetical protein